MAYGVDNYRYKKPGDPVSYRLDPAGADANQITQGDAVYLDTSNFYLVPLATGSNGPKFVGIAEGRGPTPVGNVDIEPNRIKFAAVKATGIFRMKCTVADVLTHGDAMVIGADPQSLLKQTGEDDTEIIAYYFDAEASGTFTVPAGGAEAEFVIKANFPTTGIL
jgi:hypothetical protein